MAIYTFFELNASGVVDTAWELKLENDEAALQYASGALPINLWRPGMGRGACRALCPAAADRPTASYGVRMGPGPMNRSPTISLLGAVALLPWPRSMPREHRSNARAPWSSANGQRHGRPCRDARPPCDATSQHSHDARRLWCVKPVPCDSPKGRLIATKRSVSERMRFQFTVLTVG